MSSDDTSPRIEEVFLVHKSGCLIEFMDIEKSIEVDYDLTIGMLTAIQCFVKDTFGAGQWSLKKLEFENRKIMIELADNFYLAVVYSGNATAKMNHEVARSLEIIEEKFGKVAENWNGDMDVWEGTKDLIGPIFTPDVEDILMDESIHCQLCGAPVDDDATSCPMCEFDFSLMGD